MSTKVDGRRDNKLATQGIARAGSTDELRISEDLKHISLGMAKEEIITSRSGKHSERSPTVNLPSLKAEKIDMMRIADSQNYIETNIAIGSGDRKEHRIHEIKGDVTDIALKDINTRFD